MMLAPVRSQKIWRTRNTPPRHAPDAMIRSPSMTVPPDILRHLRNFDPAPPTLSDREKIAYDRLLHFYRDGFGYAAMMNQSPQTIGYALADSPVAMAAYYYDKIASDGKTAPFGDKRPRFATFMPGFSVSTTSAMNELSPPSGKRQKTV